MVHNIRVKGCSNVCDLSNKCTFKTFIPERLPWLSVVLISVGLAVVTEIHSIVPTNKNKIQTLKTHF